eukprot:7948537-Pyramimonas_sp.AAC.1
MVGRTRPCLHAAALDWQPMRTAAPGARTRAHASASAPVNRVSTAPDCPSIAVAMLALTSLAASN